MTAPVKVVTDMVEQVKKFYSNNSRHMSLKLTDKQIIDNEIKQLLGE